MIFVLVNFHNFSQLSTLAAFLKNRKFVCFLSRNDFQIRSLLKISVLFYQDIVLFKRIDTVHSTSAHPLTRKFQKKYRVGFN